MKEDLIADLWNVVAEHLPEKYKKDVAADFINTLMDYGVKESILESLMGIDPYLDQAIDYVIDDEEIDSDNDYDYENDED